ncbi:Polyketide synthase PksM [Methyloligella halotolerans]|uniref:Polyketide synthase PksM n=1 Tax=Methyloligella halotolerans TaxID=1177755 RepID=A0A1E2RZ60_9HYPH|nr:beta-ketoacyl synthase N-terminal-like domain-containing protein [Methyloligella halotolerans]ODA67388.1 Polyketide synthase PksM [Methyloligella halotolerans]
MKSSETEILVGFLLSLFSDVTGLTSEHFDETTHFDEIGLQSLSVVAFTRRLGSFFPNLPPTFLYDCGNISDVAVYLETRYDAATIDAALGAQPPKTTVPDAPQVTPKAAPEPSDQPATADTGWPELTPLDATLGALQHFESQPSATGDIAVIGMQGRFPDAPDLESFWTNLASGVDSVREIPEDRWPLEGFFRASEGQRIPGRSYSKWGGFLSGIDCFDAQFFGVAAREAALTDPQERLLLECAWHAMESAALLGNRAEGLKTPEGSDIGVFVGLTTNSYSLLGPDRWREGDPEIPASMPWSAANRISYCLDLAGPSLTVDTACSSSLVALHLAAESLLGGECRAALAGAANLYVHPAKYVQLCQQQMLSPTGRCHSFGADADGFAPGEGVGVVVLKRLADAQADGDRILAVIKATAVNHNGRSNGYTVPKTRAQAKLVGDALRKAGLPSERIGFIEAHGTGTKLGDPIEVAGLTEVLGGKDDAPACPIASVKSNIGHLESAAGMASLIKTILQLQHGQIAPSLHATPRNPALELDRTRFFVPEEMQPWPEPAGGGLRAAGISSFGAGGTNGHVIVEEAPQQTLTAAEGPMVFPLSARNPERLRTLMETALAHLARLPEPDLPRLGYTLQCGLRHFEHRICLVGSTKAELEARLRNAMSGTTESAPSSDPGLDALAKSYMDGETIAWRDLWRGEPIPVEPPHYPFARERHWLKPLSSAPALPTEAEIAIHPHEVPTLEEHFISIPHESSLVSEHRIGDCPVVPGTAYIAHCLDAAGKVLETSSVTLQGLRWLRPVKAGKTAADLGLRILCSHQDDGAAVELEDIGAPGETCFRCDARIDAAPSASAAPSLAEARDACTEPFDPEICYARFEAPAWSTAHAIVH